MGKLSTRQRWCIFIALVFVVTGVSVLIYFFVGFKPPELNYKQSNVPKDGANAVQGDSNEVKASWDMVFELKNPNTLSVILNELTLNGFADEARTKQVTTSTLKDINLAGYSERLISLPQTFRVTKDMPQPFLDQVYKSCVKPNPDSGEKPKISIYTEMKLGYAWTFSTYWKTVQGKIDIDCPVDFSSKRLTGGGNARLQRRIRRFK